MIRKSAWLLSAGLCALSTPAFAQAAGAAATRRSQTARRRLRGQQPDRHRRSARRAGQQPVNTGDIVITATRRNEALSDVPMAVSAVTAETLHYTGATDIRQLNQLSPSLLVSSTSSEARRRGRAHPRRRHGRRQSRPRKLGRRVHRRRLPLAHRHRPDRARAARPDRGAARAAGHPVRPQHLGRPDFDHHRQAALHAGSRRPGRTSAITTTPLRRRRHRAAVDTLAARLDGVYVKRDGFLKDVISGRRRQRSRPLAASRPVAVPAERRTLVPADRRLFASSNEECCAATFLPAHDTVAAGGGSFATSPRRSPASSGRWAGSSTTIPSAATSRSRPAATIASSQGRRRFRRAGLRPRRRGADLDHRLPLQQYTARPGCRLQQSRHPLPRQRRRIVQPVQDLQPGAPASGQPFGQPPRLAGRRLLRQREAAHARQSCPTAATIAVRQLPGGRNLRRPVVRGRSNQPGLASPSLLADAGAAQRGHRSASARYRRSPGGSPIRPRRRRFRQAQLAALGPQLADWSPTSAARSCQREPGQSRFGSIARCARPARTLDFNGVSANDLLDQTSNNWALFTHNIFSITDQLKLTLGARYTHEKKTLDATSWTTTSCARCSSAQSAGRSSSCHASFRACPGGSSTCSDKLHARTSSRARSSSATSRPPAADLRELFARLQGGRLQPRPLGAVPQCADVARLSATARSASALLNRLQGSSLRARPAVQAGDQRRVRTRRQVQRPRNRPQRRRVPASCSDNFQLNTFNGINFLVENINSCSTDLSGADTDNSAADRRLHRQARPAFAARASRSRLFTRPCATSASNAGVTIADTRYRTIWSAADGEPLTDALFQLPGRQISNAPKWTATGSIAWTPPIGDAACAAWSMSMPAT